MNLVDIIIVIVGAVIAISLLAIDVLVIAPWQEKKMEAKFYNKENKNDRKRE